MCIYKYIMYEYVFKSYSKKVIYNKTKKELKKSFTSTSFWKLECN